MKLVDQVLENLSQGDKPNKFALGMGGLVRNAREEMSLTQRELAALIYRRQAALSAIENGLMQPDAETLLLLSIACRNQSDIFIPNRLNLTSA